MTDPIRVLIADDHPVVRAGLRAVLDIADDVHVVAEASTPDEAVDICASLSDAATPSSESIHLVLMDLRFGEKPGARTEAVRQAVQVHGVQSSPKAMRGVCGGVSGPSRPCRLSSGHRTLPDGDLRWLRM